MIERYQIKHFLFFDIDRFTRAGVVFYKTTKQKFQKLGCEIVDVKGIIQSERNSLEGTGGSFGQDFDYDWSKYAPSEKAELMEAQAAKDEARKILGRTIPVQIKNAQLGRTARWAPYGYKNIKIIDESGKPQPSKEIYEEEAFFVRKVYEGLAAGRDTRNLADELNQLGFKTRKLKKWNKDYTKIVGFIGGKAMTPRTILDIARRPIYAGFVAEKWTHGLPVKANHDGIVELSQWNAANKNYAQIIKSKTSPSGWEILDVRNVEQRRTYQIERPDFPYKKLIKCEHCRKPLKAGYSTSRNGTKHGYYQCSRGHKTNSIRKEGMDEIITKYLNDIEFTPEMARRFENHLRTLWVSKLKTLNRHISYINSDISALRDEADSIFEKIKIAANPTIIGRLEHEYETIEKRIKTCQSKRNSQEYSEADISRVIKYARQFVEHPAELITQTDNEGLRAILWSLLFSATPTLENVKSRTAELSPMVRLKADFQKPKSSLVEQDVVKLNILMVELYRWASLLLPIVDAIDPILGSIAAIEQKTLPKAA